MDLDSIIQKKKEKAYEKQSWGHPGTKRSHYEATHYSKNFKGGNKPDVEEVDIPGQGKDKAEVGVISLSQRNNNLRSNKRAKVVEEEEMYK